ncbi:MULTISPECIES: 4-hydroxy-2-oxovalerate aldolase [unclassified Jeotgalibaca]|uniref:4-hydroxy-2-oxovalerate aldolase n=1 Tax=unclassified Jeotgalibaca TaxID=2621505 RepID=UPI003FD05F8B
MTRKPDVIVTEVALRDGSHAVAHQYTVEQVVDVTKALNDAKVPYIEVTHGDGLGGSSLQFGMSKVRDIDLIRAAAEVADFSKISVLLLPGVGTVEDLKEAVEAGAKMVRVATHVTEADVSREHIEVAKSMGLEVVGFLMMAHMAPPEVIVEQAKLMESYGADVVYVTDSAGAMVPDQVRERVAALKENLSIPIGFHAHNNLGLAVGNSLVAIEAGATYIDGSIRALGGGAGNTQTEVLIAVLEKMGIETGVDLYKIMDAAEDIVAPLLPKPQEITRDSLTLGYAGVYSAFLLHAQRAARQFNLEPRDILIKLGEIKVVGGQEDMIYDMAAKMAEEKEKVTV